MAEARSKQSSNQSRAADVADSVDRIVDDITQPEHASAYAPDDRPARTTEDLQREQREEMEHAGVGTGLFTRAQTHGIVWGGLIVGLIGAVIGLGFGFIDWGVDVSLAMRLITTAVIGFLAGAAIGAVYWGGRLPELEGEMTNSEHEPSAGSSLSDPTTDERGRRRRRG